MPATSLASSLRWCWTCGRSFNWRPTMSADWENVKYCSKTCRAKKPHANRTDQGIERSFLQLLLPSATSSSPCKITCEQVQQADGAERTQVAWRERYRRAARRLANVQQLCDIEHDEKNNGTWKMGDGKGEMRVWVRDGKQDAAAARLQELETTSRPASPG